MQFLNLKWFPESWSDVRITSTGLFQWGEAAAQSCLPDLWPSDQGTRPAGPCARLLLQSGSSSSSSSLQQTDRRPPDGGQQPSSSSSSSCSLLLLLSWNGSASGSGDRLCSSNTGRKVRKDKLAPCFPVKLEEGLSETFSFVSAPSCCLFLYFQHHL